jgi:holo-[acyl-carrier protein] synthase
VGIDLVEVESVEEAVRVHADRYLERIYTSAELTDCRTPEGVDAERLAARFAAKEATIKVLRPGREQAIPWSSIGVRRSESGSVDLELTGAAAELASEAGIDELAVSLTHEAGIAGAVVLAGKGGR